MTYSHDSVNFLMQESSNLLTNHHHISYETDKGHSCGKDKGPSFDLISWIGQKENIQLHNNAAT
jgi:hypothetical protein